MTTARGALLFTLVLTIDLVAAAPQGGAPTPLAPVASHGSFEHDVRPMVNAVCSQCHLEIAGVPLAVYAQPSSFTTAADGWERILTRLRGREMPPAGSDVEPMTDVQTEAAIAFVESEFDRIDRSTPVNPGRIPTHRLNRVEYANSVRDLLGVVVRPDDEFPPDDSGYGFDNIGDVLTVSPALMQKYLSVAEKVAARAVGGDPLPPPGIFTRRDRVRRVGDGEIELREIVDYDAEYLIKVHITGHRGDDDPPVTLVISVDGKPVKTAILPVQISAVNKQAGETQRAIEEVRVVLPSNAHVFRAEFVNDVTLAKILPQNRSNNGQNIYPQFIDVSGPYKPPTPPVVERKALVCNPATGPACVNRILTTLARRAYRRPATGSDVSRLTKVYDKAKLNGYSPARSLQFALTALLVSPQFLFKVEKDPAPGTVARVSDVELASRLSSFLWSSIPDEQLLAAGEANRLHLPDVLSAQVTRMLADPRALAFADNFTGQWLETRSLDAVKRDATRFRDWTPELRDAMRTETLMFFQNVVSENRPIADFIDGKYSFLNEKLARHYGIEGVEGSAFRRVTLTTPERSGVFTQGSVLTVSSYPTRTSVVLRGKFLLDNVFNAPPPPPPADVPGLDETKVGVANTLRLQMESHRTQAICASCHSRMDPLGFALENYDAIGKWRTKDGEFAVDARGSFPNGKSFAGPSDLKTILLGSLPDFTRGLSERMLTYALGRGVEPYDRATIRSLVKQTTEADGRIQSLIQGIVKSAPFQQRRGAPKPSAQEARNQ